MSNEDEDNLWKFNCSVCGIAYGLEPVVVKAWQKSHKFFACPNGHSLSWKEQTAEEKELQELRDKVKSLEEQLATTNTNLEAQTKLVTELQTELEIWRPSEGK